MDTDTIYDLIGKTLEKKRKNSEARDVLEELYDLVDDYNNFIKTMDSRFDSLVSKLEKLLDDKE